ncbi:MAG: hypothetical protein JWR35_499 [Marmoricola sp.]|nr:hypothetical protein [Marmoricola sp.]
MTDNMLEARPEIAEFMTQVRARLADLDPEEQRELTDGLEADLTDLVAEHGSGALGDPQDYARELRTAAGLDPVTGKVREHRPIGESIDGFLDAAHDRWDRAFAMLPGSPSEFVKAIQPVWWIARAWLAVELVDVYFGRSPHTPVPSIHGPLIGATLVLAAAIVSVQLGRQKLWPASLVQGSVVARLVLLGLNLTAVVLTPTVLSQFPASGQTVENHFYYQSTESTTIAPSTLISGDKGVTNVFPYDAQGHPLTGVQLFDQDGRPLDVRWTNGSYDAADTTAVAYPWVSGGTEAFNVFPQAQRRQSDDARVAGAWSLPDPPKISWLARFVVPHASLPGVTPSDVVLPAGTLHHQKAR